MNEEQPLYRKRNLAGKPYAFRTSNGKSAMEAPMFEMNVGCGTQNRDVPSLHKL